MSKIKNRQARGFTLIELIITLGIAVILGGVSMSNYFGYQSKQAVDGVSSELLGTLRDAQQRAKSQDNSSAWGVYINAVSGANDYYELFYGASYAAGTVSSRTTLSSDVQFSVPAQGATLEIVFAKSTGLPNSEYTITVASTRNSSIAETTTLNTTTGIISTISGVASAPTVSSITPNYGSNNGSVNISNLAGTNFQQGASVKLTKTGQTDISCTSVVFVSPIKLTASCDLTSKATGLWNVVVTNSDNQNGALSDGFTVAFSCGVTLTDSRDSKTYATVLIGTQCWMKQGINIGTRIASTSAQTDNGILEKYCSNDTDAICDSNNNPNYPDGGLYRWAEAMQYAASCNGTGESQPACTTPVQGICPAGWHIPSHYELTALERAICTPGTCVTDFPYDTTTVGWRGTDEGTKLKPNGSSGFEGNLASASNESANRGVYGHFWSSLEGNLNPVFMAWSRTLHSGDAAAHRSENGKTTGFSIRCLKD